MTVLIDELVEVGNVAGPAQMNFVNGLTRSIEELDAPPRHVRRLIDDGEGVRPITKEDAQVDSFVERLPHLPLGPDGDVGIASDLLVDHQIVPRQRHHFTQTFQVGQDVVPVRTEPGHVFTAARDKQLGLRDAEFNSRIPDSKMRPLNFEPGPSGLEIQCIQSIVHDR